MLTLNNVANAVEKVLQEGDVVATEPSFSVGLSYALMFADLLIPLSKTKYVTISAFGSMKDSGLFFHCEMTGQACKVMSHPVAGGVMMYLGGRYDFAFPSRLAHETLEPICFEIEELRDYVHLAVEHLEKPGRKDVPESEIEQWREFSQRQY